MTATFLTFNRELPDIQVSHLLNYMKIWGTQHKLQTKNLSGTTIFKVTLRFVLLIQEIESCVWCQMLSGEVEQYCSMDPMSEEIKPLLCWNPHSNTFPNLSKMEKDILAIPASSVRSIGRAPDDTTFLGENLCQFVAEASKKVSDKPHSEWSF